jgi:hypothetical protein
VADADGREQAFDTCGVQPTGTGRYTEHWTCECWDTKKSCWRLFDTEAMAGGNANCTGRFARRFEYAAESWKKLRRGAKPYSDEAADESSDHRSRVRSQLLWDFASLLNHDVPDDGDRTADTRRFVEERKLSDLSARELEQLDQLAELLSNNPGVEDLVAFYRKASTLRLESAENDPYSYVFR